MWVVETYFWSRYAVAGYHDMIPNSAVLSFMKKAEEILMLKLILHSSVSAPVTELLDTQTSFAVQTKSAWQSPTVEKNSL